MRRPAHGAEPTLAWPQFRGPNGSGVADGQKPPVEFGPDKNVKWKVPAPSGLSSPIVAGDKLVITAFDDGKLYTIAYNRADGKEAWRAEAPAKQIEPYLQDRGQPGRVHARDRRRADRFVLRLVRAVLLRPVGQGTLEVRDAAGGTPGNFGSGVSPILADGIVVLVRDEMKDSKILALDAATGTLRWEKKRQSPVSYCTPVVWDTPAGKQVVAAGHGRMIGYDLKTGAEKWSVAGMPSGCCSSPVAADGTLFFAGWSPGGPDDKEFQMPTFDALLKDLDKDKDGALSTRGGREDLRRTSSTARTRTRTARSRRDEWDAILKFMSEGKNSAFALKAGGTGDVTKSHVLWKKTKGLPYVASAIVYRGQYVMVKDGGIVTAYDAKTGKEVYRKRAVAAGSYYASPVAANGHIYFTSLDDGVVTVLKAGRRQAGGGGQEPEARRARGGHPGDRGRHAVRPDGRAPVRVRREEVMEGPCRICTVC